MPSPARNLANFLGTGNTTVPASKLSADVPRGTENYSDINSLGVGTNIGQKAFIQETNRLYIWNGTGWYNIALLNDTPTWDSGGQPNSSYLLNTGTPPSDTIINLSASDPEGFPITYSYLKSSSMDSIATVSQDSSVFTISPKTQAQAPSGGSGTINFKASDGINILNQESSFTLVFGIQIEYLLVGGGGGGGDRHGGGGGGGSVATGSLLASASTTYNFTIGSGGAAGDYQANLYRLVRGQGLNGGNTTAFGLTAYGGQGGNTYDGLTNSMNDNPGGGGGGAGGRSGSPAGVGANGAGNGGATGYGAAGGGGGGAGGNDGGPATNGIGGDGYLWTENNTYYGGGGGGATNSSGATYAGGAGGGGTGVWGGSANDNGGDGTDGLGAGGGGCRSSTVSTIGGAGGSGGVVIRFSDSITPAATTGNPTITTSGGYKEYWFKTPGSASITF